MSAKQFSPSTRDYTVPDTARSPYAPGAIREGTDRELAVLQRARAKLPVEYARLSDEQLFQAMATYRDDHERAVREDLRGEGMDGVRLGDWCTVADTDFSDNGPRWSDDA